MNRKLAVVFVRLSLQPRDMEHLFMGGWELLGCFVNAWPSGDSRTSVDSNSL